MTTYETIAGRSFDLTALSEKESAFYRSLLAEYEKKPHWGEFSNFWQKTLRPVLFRLGGEEKVQHILYKIAQDLEMRLGIEQGQVAPPDYRDYLVSRIEEKFGSRYKFCQEAKITQAALSQVLSGKKNFSIETLSRAAAALDLGIALVPRDQVTKLPPSADITSRKQMESLCAQFANELATLDTVHKHLEQFKAGDRMKVFRKQASSIVPGGLEKILSEVDRFDLDEAEKGMRVLQILDSKRQALLALLEQLRDRLAELEDNYYSRPISKG